jgi:hypothetical protein
VPVSQMTLSPPRAHCHPNSSVAKTWASNHTGTCHPSSTSTLLPPPNNTDPCYMVKPCHIHSRQPSPYCCFRHTHHPLPLSSPQDTPPAGPPTPTLSHQSQYSASASHPAEAGNPAAHCSCPTLVPLLPSTRHFRLLAPSAAPRVGDCG